MSLSPRLRLQMTGELAGGPEYTGRFQPGVLISVASPVGFYEDALFERMISTIQNGKTLLVVSRFLDDGLNAALVIHECSVGYVLERNCRLIE